MFDTHIVAQRQQQTQTHSCVRVCVQAAGASHHITAHRVRGADAESFIWPSNAVQHVSQASLEFQLALESFIQPSTLQKGSTARRRASGVVAKRKTRPNTTHFNTRHEFFPSHFPPLGGRSPLVSKMERVVGVSPNVGGVSGKQIMNTATEVNGKSTMQAEVNGKSTVQAEVNGKSTVHAAASYLQVSASNTRLPRVWTRSQSREASRVKLLEPSVPLALHESSHGLKVNKSDAYMLVPSNGVKSHLQQKKNPFLSAPTGKCMWEGNDVELKWEDFHSWNPGCSYDVFLRCWSWLKDQYMKVPELRPHYCKLQSFLLDSDSDEL